MTKVNAKAAAAPTREEMMEAYLKLKAENEALKAAKPASSVSITDKGQILVTVPAGNGFITARYYAWHWDAILKNEKEIRAACKSEKAMTEAKFRASK